MDLTQFLLEACRRGASDLHLSSGMPPMYRIDGDLTCLENSSLLEHQCLRDELMKICPRQVAQNLEQDFSFALSSGERFRVNVFFQARGISAAFRVISNTIPNLESLSEWRVLKDLCRLSHGLVLVTGPAGSGKSTTLAAMIQHINLHQASHIITMEDPIEYIYQCHQSLIQQREVGQHSENFQSALRASLREDPGVILVGEIRDLDTIRLALTAAETGHLVFATLHTHSCAATINRIIDVFPEGDKSLVRNMLASSLQAVISQILVKKRAGGRVAAQEIMIATTAIRHLIRENKTQQIDSVIQTGKASGMRTMECSLKELTASEII